ncbi:MAG: S1 RNA-binding domain-containing protein [Oscillospiraceae bacterium]|jgi:S1 RNA binding domain protein|nr:S1 RNA-binding domain-containing protein [Oscillospiraceae bacterium]
MQLEIGKIYEGKITGITKFGAFVDLGEGKTGMVHISEVAPTYVKEITDYLSQGQTVRVKVLNVAEDGKISLSVKQAADPQPQQQRPSRPRQPRQNGGDRRPPFQQSRDFSHPPQPQESSGSKDFEDMLSRFMQRSDEKMSDLKRTMDTGSRRGSYQRRPK